MRTQRQLGDTTERIARVYERLSSGQRINRASDDAAGLAIASSLNASSRIFNQGVRNINDALSVMGIAEGALGALRDITIRQKELAEQAANGSYSTTQRQAINTEANALVNEFNRIVATTTFNKIKLFDPDLGNVSIQAGESSIAINFSNILSRPVGDGTFQAGATMSTGSGPVFLRSGDFNGDGFADIISTDSTSARVSIFIGNGDGSFRSSITYTTGTSPQSVALGDINGDGKLDFVTSDIASNRASIFLGNGNGTFLAPISLTTGSGPRSVALGDFNNDGKVDIITAASTGNRVDVFLGNGDGSFQSALTSTVGTGVYSVALGDINGDGKLDAITADSTAFQASILLGNGDGTFQPRTVIATGLTPRAASLIDLNGDSKLDLVMGEFGSSQVSVYFGNGDGSFLASLTLAAGTGTNSVDFADFNGDGWKDIVTGDSSAGQMSIFLNNGDGTFKSRLWMATGATTRAVTVGDFNSDGRPDVAGVTLGTSSVNTFLGSAKFATSTPILDLKTQQSARDSMSTIDGALERIEGQLGQLGAYSSRLQSALNTLQAGRENYLAAASRIMDADIAAETAALVRTQILQKAASAVLAQANQQPSLVLQLLK